MATRDPKQPVVIDLEDDDSVALVPWEYIADKFDKILSPVLTSVEIINDEIDTMTACIKALNDGGGGGGGGGGMTPSQVQTMIERSIDKVVSSTSTNSIQNKVIKKYVDDTVADAITDVLGDINEQLEDLL